MREMGHAVARRDLAFEIGKDRLRIFSDFLLPLRVLSLAS